MLSDIIKGSLLRKFVFMLSFLPNVEPREKTKRRHREKEKAPSHGGRPQKSKVDWNSHYMLTWNPHLH